MSWLTITLIVVVASFLLAYGVTEWLARRDRQRASAPPATQSRRAPAEAPSPRRRTDRAA